MRASRVVGVCCALYATTVYLVAANAPGAGRGAVGFARDVWPIFQENCVSCHGAQTQKSGFRLDVKAVALKGGDLGRAIVPGDGGKSPLIAYVSGTHPEIRMPPKGKGLSAGQVEVLRAWIDQGAVWPEAEAEAASRPQVQWSLQPLTRPAVPEPPVKGGALVRTPIDAFILQKLSDAGLAPSAAADRRTLIRRVTFDLTGLPPTPEEAAAFLADESADAYEKVVDRLLESPRYGERWARHWMDVVHYAETHGHDEDKPRPHAWPYRDYLIRSFNEDKPYARFVEEQVAGDALYPQDPQGVVATAFLAVGPWDQSSQMGIQDDTLDKQVARYLDRDDMIATVMSTFVSATVHCARCHHHKFDPISQEDYYALQAVFAGVDRIDVPYDSDRQVHLARRALLGEKARLERGEYSAGELLGAEVQARVAEWETAYAKSAQTWRVLSPVAGTCANGTALGIQPDGSILAGGSHAEKDTYSITGVSDLGRVTAIRLEVLTDPSLPANGPGRAENGNLHLSAIRVTAAPRRNPAATRPVVIAGAVADFDQKDWEVAKVIDGKPETAWGIFPQVGKPHVAVFTLKEPVAFDDGTVLTVALEQSHGRGHLIGRPRLSVTSVSSPASVNPLPDSIAAIVASAGDRRSEDQRIELARYVLKARTDQRLAALPAPQRVYAVASDFEARGNFKPARKPREVNVLRRGDIRQPTEPASPGALSCVSGVDARFQFTDPQDESARRAALAKWITHRDNVLTWRSIVNRVWHYHFGRGIVDTPNDLGKMGGSPSHPQLLDWLAVTFRDDLVGSLKRLHRLVVTSGVYRQSSRHDDRAARIDAENRLLWRMNRSRLDAEQVRDAALAVSGGIDLTMGGPSVKQFVETKGNHETPNVDYAAFDVDNPASRRRSVYRFVFRTIPDPLMRSLDCPDASQLTAARQSSVTPLQALAMLNNAFMVRQSEHLAGRLAKVNADPKKQVEALYELALGRPANPQEVSELVEYAQKHGMPNACRMVLNINEFMFVN